MVHWGSVTCDPPTPIDQTDAAWRSHLIDQAGVVGLSSVTEDNVEEWMWRLTFLRRTLSQDVGCLQWLDGPGKGTRRERITMAVLRRWIGLWTNWPNEKRPAWVKHRIDRLTQDCDATVRVEREALSKADAAKAKPKKKRRVKA